MPTGSDLGTIVRDQGPSFVHSHRTSAVQRKALRAIAACRTPAMGGHRERCDHCGHERIRWHSCRNRACPKCGGSARIAWLEQRQAEILPVPYFHVVFTIPEQLNGLAIANHRVFYDLLFRAVGTTLEEVGHSRLHVQLGLLSVLHTWSQTLVLHPHIHCVVPGGGFSHRNGRWVSVRSARFFLPVKVLSRRFRTNLCSLLEQRFTAGKLRVEASAFSSLLAQARTREWVVYCKPPFAGPDRVLRYLANYTHRIAISDHRLVRFDGTSVSFRYRDSASGDTQKVMTLDAQEFLRRFLLHVLPTRFVRIRYYGCLANRVRTRSIARARASLARVPCRALPVPTQRPPASACPICETGLMIQFAPIPPQSAIPSFEDSS